MAREVATLEENQVIPLDAELPEHLRNYIGEGKGVSEDPSDRLIPIITVLDTKAQQVNPRNPNYIPGAEPGMIWLRNSRGRDLISGEEGFLFQYCLHLKTWVEWGPRERGGGFFGRWPDKKGKPVCPDARPLPGDRYKWQHGDNELVQTIDVIGHVLTEQGLQPFSIPLKGTGQAEFKNFNALVPKTFPDGRKSDPWVYWTRWKAIPKRNTYGEWFLLRGVKLVGLCNAEAIAMGKALEESFKGGELGVEIEGPASRQEEDEDTPL